MKYLVARREWGATERLAASWAMAASLPLEWARVQPGCFRRPKNLLAQRQRAAERPQGSPGQAAASTGLRRTRWGSVGRVG